MAQRNVKRPAPKDRTTYVRLEQADFDRLVALSQKEDRPMSALIRRAVREFLKRGAA